MVSPLRTSVIFVAFSETLNFAFPGESDSILSEKAKDDVSSVATETDRKTLVATGNIAREVRLSFSARSQAIAVAQAY